MKRREFIGNATRVGGAAALVGAGVRPAHAQKVIPLTLASSHPATLPWVGFMSSVKPMIQAHIDTHSFVHFVPLLHQWLDMPDIVGMMAPKPLMVQQCREDALFPLTGMQQSIDKLAAIYSKAGAPDRFAGRFYDGGHRFNVPMQQDAFDWFDKQLGNT